MVHDVVTPLDTLAQQVSYGEAGYGVAVNPRRLGVLVLLAALGVGAGYGLGAMLADDDPERFDDAAPVAATSPSVPSNPEVEVLDDPDTAALERGLPTHLEKIGFKPSVVRVPVPDDWILNNTTAGEWKWRDPVQPDDNTFFLRIRQVSNTFQEVSAALEERIGDLSGAESVSSFELESQSSDTFVASYVSLGYRRVAMESFVSTDGNDQADLWIAVIGRERDRAGLSDLLAQVRAGIKV
jgi:hypothetical protein